jgi:hypothetical protein
MRKTKKARPAKKAVKQVAKHRASPKKHASSPSYLPLPRVVAPPMQPEPRAREASQSPLMFWSALPFAMMRMFLAPLEHTARK